jgi:hypothetical protein
MNTRKERVFTCVAAKRIRRPLWIGIMGAQGAGKTKSALEIAFGIIVKRACGKVVVLDLDNNRCLDYAEKYPFFHMPMDPPYGSEDIIDGLKAAEAAGATVIIVDGMSEEQEGEGGQVEAQKVLVDKLAKGDPSKYDRYNMIAWAAVKEKHKLLYRYIKNMKIDVIFLWRAKSTAKPVKNKEGKVEVKTVGFDPIGGDDLLFLMTLCLLLMPNSQGVPTLHSDEISEKLMVKNPEYLRDIFADGKALSKEHGRKLAEWADGPEPTLPNYTAEGESVASQGVAALESWWRSIPPSNAKKDAAQHLPSWKSIAEKADTEASKATEPILPEVLDNLERITGEALDQCVAEMFPGSAVVAESGGDSL